ncbi:MAG TPA: hypothetical protein ENK10_03025 [Acidobacteria bacterium]|nr:hypothetical protein [Acidobacteriota bacterium]
MTARALLEMLRRLTPPAIEELLMRDRVIRRAQAYAAENRVDEVWLEKDALRAHVSGSSETPYHTVVRLREGHLDAECSCPYERGLCWHVGAVLLTLATHGDLIDALEEHVASGGREGSESPLPEGESGEETTGAAVEGGGGSGRSSAQQAALRQAHREEIEDLLLCWPRQRLVEILTQLALDDGGVEARIRRFREEPTDIDLRLFRQAGRTALRPGVVLDRYEVARIAADLHEVAASVRRLVRSGHPEQALDLLLELASMAWARAAEVDDRDGALEGFVREVLQTWIRGWEDIDGRDRQRLAREIFGWLMEDSGSLTRGLIFEGRGALGPTGLETLSNLLTPVLEHRQQQRPVILGGEEGLAHADPLAERVRAALRETAEAQGDIEEFLRHCDAAGGQGVEVLAAARRLEREGRLDEALDWVERGRRRARGTARASLEDLRISLLHRLGRRRQAIEAAWESFVSQPGAHTFARLQETAGEHERGQWRSRAIDHAEASSDATAFVEICLSAREVERLAHRLDASPGFVLAASPAVLDRAALMFEERSAWASARIHQHLATRLLSEGDARHYGKAREHIEGLRRACEKDDDAAAWESALEHLARNFAVVRAWFPPSDEQGR